MKIRIASPCSARWDLMQGDERVCYCAECELNVYNFSAMSSAEVERVIADTEGRLCARFYRRPDGTMLTRDCPKGFRAAAVQVARVASAAFAALMSVVPAIAQSASQTNPTQTNAGEAEESSAAVLVLDVQDAPIAGAEVNLTDTASSKVYSGRSDHEGKVRFPNLPKGKYDVAVMANGFTRFLATKVALPSGQVMKARLDVGQGGAIVVIETGMHTPIENTLMNVSAPIHDESYEAILNPRPRRNFVNRVATAIKRIF